MAKPEVSNHSRSFGERTIGDYLDRLASSDPTPGGGSAAGVIGALGASLGLMVIALTSSEDEILGEAQNHLDELNERFASLGTQDETAFQGFRDAAALPRTNPEEKRARRAVMQRALKGAATVPLEMAAASLELASALADVTEFGNPHLESDARIALLCARTCFNASTINVNVNLAMIKDDEWVQNVSQRLEAMAMELQD